LRSAPGLGCFGALGSGDVPTGVSACAPSLTWLDSPVHPVLSLRIEDAVMFVCMLCEALYPSNDGGFSFCSRSFHGKNKGRCCKVGARHHETRQGTGHQPHPPPAPTNATKSQNSPDSIFLTCGANDKYVLMRRPYEHVFTWPARRGVCHSLVFCLLAQGLEVQGLLAIRLVEGWIWWYV
jgi:hypothetical protein